MCSSRKIPSPGMATSIPPVSSNAAFLCEIMCRGEDQPFTTRHSRIWDLQGHPVLPFSPPREHWAGPIMRPSTMVVLVLSVPVYAELTPLGPT